MQQPASGDLIEALQQGALTLQGQFLLGSNYTFLLNVEHVSHPFQAVYKPMRGEQPLWDFPPASLAGREVAAWLVSEALGWGLVPATVLRSGPYGPGSLQQYIEYDPTCHYFTFQADDIRLLKPVALFDLLINNADRKGSHVLFESGSHHLYAIDHGLCFHVEDKLRTVIWAFAGEPFPEDLLADLRRLQEKHDSLQASLAACLLPEEWTAFAARLEGLIADPVYPHPPEDRRAYPYPPL